MSAPYFFGYGSLVNRATHTYPDASPARLNGWRRVWRHTDWHRTAFLSVVQAKGAQIDGLIAHVPGGDWVALDAREGGYQRQTATEAVTHEAGREIDIALYLVADDWQDLRRAPRPILLSYVDVVIQGFLREFGPKGATRFFTTTDGWDAPVLNDRADPCYPRHQRLSAYETGFVDEHLDELSVRIVDNI